MWWCLLMGGSFRGVATQPGGPSWSQGSARSQSPRLALSRAVVTSAGSSVPCSRRDCRCDVSTRIRQFARARGVLAKNDRLDARLIAEYVAIMPTRVVQRDAAVERLAEIVTMRRQLCDEHAAAENQAAHLEDAMLRRLSKRRQMRLEADIRLLDKRLAETVAANVALAQRYDLLTSMPGVGPVLAFTRIALLPELGKMSRKQIAALVGLAPYDFDSGKLKGHRSIYGARMPVRNVLYMAALSASRYSPALKTFHKRLAAADKKSKVIIVAVMRKMITTLNAMLRDSAAWQPRSA